ncbi:MAG TPA: ABC transporter ATP-binding protein, partial [Chloroflexi bacterium]|nr:ABC transporter ATP-binding protein [Chloroflexota bacterium]
MSQATLSAEFTLPKRKKTDRGNPLRWLFSHTIVYWYFWIVLLIGAFGNAALASVVPILTGQAIDAVGAKPPLTDSLIPIALWIAGTQIVRGVLQLGRNFGAELIGQSMERDIRDELYVSLLGKSMTFHSLQPVGDTMARATNDV